MTLNSVVKLAYTAHMKRFRHLITLLLLLAYVGQSVAVSGAPCFMMGAASGAMSADMAGMNHSGHDMGSPEQVVADGSSCCDGGGFCSMSHCQSIAGLAETAVSDTVTYTGVRLDTASFSSPSFSSGSLYRPPISR